MGWKTIKSKRWLKKAVRTILTVQLVGCLISILCATFAGPGYLGNRMRDAADVFTATVGAGLGAKTRVGPAQLGILLASDMWGLRGGQYGNLWINGRKTQNDDWLAPWPPDRVFGEEHALYDEEIPNRRGKGFHAKSPLPVIGLAPNPAYYTQMEVVIGVGVSVRLGFNPGELLDFLLGWANIDIYGDDLPEHGSDSMTN